MEYEFHEYANLFPMMGEKELHELSNDIKTRGLIEPVILYEGKILDGRNRYRACIDAQVKPKIKEFEDKTGAGPLMFVLSKNLHRRHLTESQRAMVGAKLATLQHGQKKADAQICASSQSEAAEQCKVSRRSIQTAREVLDHGTEELIDAVEQGEVSVSAAAEVSQLSEEDQTRIVNAGAEEVRRVAAEIRQKKSSEMSRIYERATKALSSWREKFMLLGEDDLRMIFDEVFGGEKNA